MTKKFLNGSNVIYMDVVYADFAGAKIGQHHSPKEGLQKNGVRHDSSASW